MCDENNEVANTASPLEKGIEAPGESRTPARFFSQNSPGAPTTLVGFTDELCLRITAVRWSPTLRGLTKCRGVGVRASVLNVFPSTASHAVRSPTLSRIYRNTPAADNRDADRQIHVGRW